MRIRFVPGGTGLVGLMLLLVACGPQCGSTHIASATTSCNPTNTSHRAYVVVEHASGNSITRCVGFTGDSIDGETAMRLSGLEYQSAPIDSGKAMCQVDLEPAKFDRCFPQNQPYWALFVESHGHWGSAAGGYVQVNLHDGDALGWHYVSANDSAPAPPPLPPTM